MSEGSESLVCAGTYGSFTREYKELGRFLGVRSEAFTPHGLRRGGATWHFGLFFSYDRTQEHGRWSHQRTARQYIDVAMAEAGLGEMSAPALERISRAARCLGTYLYLHAFSLTYFVVLVSWVSDVPRKMETFKQHKRVLEHPEHFVRGFV